MHPACGALGLASLHKLQFLDCRVRANSVAAKKRRKQNTNSSHTPRGLSPPASEHPATRKKRVSDKRHTSNHVCFDKSTRRFYGLLSWISCPEPGGGGWRRSPREMMSDGGGQIEI